MNGYGVRYRIRADGAAESTTVVDDILVRIEYPQVAALVVSKHIVSTAIGDGCIMDVTAGIPELLDHFKFRGGFHIHDPHLTGIFPCDCHKVLEPADIGNGSTARGLSLIHI